jgi:hypothetical protein
MAKYYSSIMFLGVVSMKVFTSKGVGKMRKTLVALLAVVLLSGCVSIGGWRWMAVASTSRLYVGMTRAELQKVMPYPSDINTTRTESGTREQICWNTQPSTSKYRMKPVYVYVDNGIVTGWQG